jgi:hypothetical protein
MSEKEEKKKSKFVTLSPTKIEVTGSMVWAIGFAVVRSVHEAVVTNVLGTVEVIVASVGTILTVEQLQRWGSECRSRLMITWATEQPVDIIFVIVDNNGIPNRSQRWER